ncbi:MAG TPA: DUF302 domain-containing protein [Candidatus Acidoferrales bacterium]|nr:DUF302 domain-containing protein [Candidatus Acidoferrales bacterium]
MSAGNQQDRSNDVPSAPGIVTKHSRYTVSEMMERLEKVVRGNGLQVFGVIDHSGEAAKVGLRMQEAKLVIFGSPKAGTPLMIASPLLALDLPLKALVWMGSDGHAWVSYNSTTYLANRYNLPSDLTGNIAGIDALIDSALSS